MAAFIQDGGTNGGAYAKNFSAFLTVWENSYDIAANTSNVGYRLQLKSGSQGRFSDLTANYSVTLNGIVVNSGSGRYNSQSYNTYQTICEGTTTILHNDDGSKTISCSCVLDFQTHTYSPGDFTLSGTLTLTTIPRYTNVVNSLRNNGLDSISINWATTEARDYTQYSLNNAEWKDADDIVSSDNRSGYYIITNLEPNTTYTVKTRCKRMDSGLWSEADTIIVKTYDIARISELNNFEHGNSMKVIITNPASIEELNLVVEIEEEIILSRNILEEKNIIEFTESELDNIYKKYENKNSLLITAKLYGKGYTDTKKCTIIFKGNQRTIKINTNNEYKRGKIWINIAEEWKRAIIWAKINETWRRSI